MTRLPLILTFIFISTFASAKTYPLNYRPSGKIIQLTFDGCVLYTDSNSYFLAAKSLLTDDFDKLEFSELCKSVRDILKNSDTLKVDLRDDPNNKDTLNDGYNSFISTAFKLVKNKKALIYSDRAKLFVDNVEIKVVKKKHRKNRYWHIRKSIIDKRTGFELVYSAQRKRIICF